MEEGSLTVMDIFGGNAVLDRLMMMTIYHLTLIVISVFLVRAGSDGFAKV